MTNRLRCGDNDSNAHSLRVYCVRYDIPLIILSLVKNNAWVELVLVIFSPQGSMEATLKC
jgi:hypothetical protein